MASHHFLDANTLRQLELLQLRSRRAFLGSRQGGHTSLKRGHGIEFSDYRKYELGDDPRHIDWGVYARSERLYVKRFQEEEDLAVSVIIDGSASMHTPVSDNKWVMACKIGIAVAYVALMQQDRVVVAVPGKLNPPFMSGGSAFHTISQLLERVTEPVEQDFLTAATQTLSRITYPGVAVLISDFLMPFDRLQSYLQHMQSKNLDITIVHILGINDRNPYADLSDIVAIDSETGESFELTLNDQTRADYAYLLHQHSQQIQRYCSERAIRYALIDAEQTLGGSILDSITKAGLFS